MAVSDIYPPESCSEKCCPVFCWQDWSVLHLSHNTFGLSWCYPSMSGWLGASSQVVPLLCFVPGSSASPCSRLTRLGGSRWPHTWSYSQFRPRPPSPSTPPARPLPLPLPSDHLLFFGSLPPFWQLSSLNQVPCSWARSLEMASVEFLLLLFLSLPLCLKLSVLGNQTVEPVRNGHVMETGFVTGLSWRGEGVWKCEKWLGRQSYSFSKKSY